LNIKGDEMDIVVCVKRVPDTSEADLQITQDGKSIETKGLVFDVNDWDRYAVEEAVRLKEKYGGTVTAVTIGPAESDDVLRRSFATGADYAIRLDDPAYAGSDSMATAKILCGALKELKYDLILFGTQAGDDGYGFIGQAVAAMLGLPFASLVINAEISDNIVKAHRELEAGMTEVVELPMPSVLTVQTGINEPRYVSIMGIRKASSKEIKTPPISELALETAEIGESGSVTRTERLYIPPVTKEAEMLSGNLDEVSLKLAQLLKEKGGTI
jgi:electron transfer flavoprotein beta subunit